MKNNKQNKKETMKPSLLIRVVIIIVLLYQVPHGDYNTMTELLFKLPILLLDEIQLPEQKKKDKKGKSK